MVDGDFFALVDNEDSGLLKKVSKLNLGAMRGVAVFVQETKPTDPQLNDIWIII